ncbi:MAM domain containing 4 [Mactra antiquata]
MNGFGIGHLSLNAISDNASVTLWEKNGRQGKGWIKETVTVSPGLVKLQFKSAVRLPLGSDVAIDDIELSSESQVLNNTHCFKTTTSTSTTTTTTTTTTTPKPATTKRITTNIPTTLSSTTSVCRTNTNNGVLLDGTCDFETDTCGFELIPDSRNKEVTWNRTNQMDGNRKLKDTSIFYDHTKGNTSQTHGYYMDFLNGRGIFWPNPKNVARMKTPIIYATELCLSFWYSMPQPYSNLKLLTEDQHGRMTLIFDSDKDPNHSNKSGWHLLTIGIEQAPPFRIIFQSVNNYHMARAGIDDVKIVGYNNLLNNNTTPFATEGTTTTTTSEPLSSPNQDLSSSPVTVTNNNSTPLSTEVPTKPPTSTIKEAASPNTEVTSSKESTKFTSSSTETESSTSSTALQSTKLNTMTTVTVESSSPSTPATSVATNIDTSPPAKMSTSSSSTISSPVTTDKGNKKTTIATSKKPGNGKLGETNSLNSDQNDFERASTAVGAGVGAFAGVVFLGFAFYCVVTLRAKQRDTAYSIDSENIKDNHRQGIDDSKQNGRSFIAVNNMGFILESDGKIGNDELPIEDKTIDSKPDKVTFL